MRNIHDFKAGTLEFGINNFPSGVYFTTLFTKDKLITKKFIVQR